MEISQNLEIEVPKIKRYKPITIVGTNILIAVSQMEESVNNYVKEGWQIHGELMCVSWNNAFNLIQVMVKY